MNKQTFPGILLATLLCGCPCYVAPPSACLPADAGSGRPVNPAKAFSANETASSQLAQLETLFDQMAPRVQPGAQSKNGHQSMSLEQVAAARDYADLLPEVARSLAQAVARDAEAAEQAGNKSLIRSGDGPPSFIAMHTFLKTLSTQRKALRDAMPSVPQSVQQAPQLELNGYYRVDPVTCEECIGYCDTGRWKACGACMVGWADKLSQEGHLEVCRCWPTDEPVEWQLMAGCMHITADKICAGA